MYFFASFCIRQSSLQQFIDNWNIQVILISSWSQEILGNPVFTRYSLAMGICHRVVMPSRVPEVKTWMNPKQTAFPLVLVSRMNILWTTRYRDGYAVFNIKLEYCCQLSTTTADTVNYIIQMSHVGILWYFVDCLRETLWWWTWKLLI